jgi:hypothetical protein
MEAHAGTVRIPTPTEAKPRRRGRLLQLLREVSRAHRERAIQTHDARVRSIPGSEHTHLIRRPPGF